MKIIGCDFHTRYQQIAIVDEATGEMIERRLDHQSGEAQTFCRELQGPVRVGIEGRVARPLKLKLGCPVLEAFSRAGLLTLRFALASAYGIDADQPGFLLRIERETTPGPILRMSDKFALHGVHVHVVKLLDELGLTPDVKIVEAGLGGWPGLLHFSMSSLLRIRILLPYVHFELRL